MLILKVRQMQFQEIMIDSPSRSSRPASAPLRCSKATFDRCLLYNLNFLFFIFIFTKMRGGKWKERTVTCSHGHMILCSTPQSPCYILGLPERIHDYNGYSGHWYIRQTRHNHFLIRSFIILHFSGKSNVSFLSRNNSHIHSEYIDMIRVHLTHRIRAVADKHKGSDDHSSESQLKIHGRVSQLEWHLVKS